MYIFFVTDNKDDDTMQPENRKLKPGYYFL